VHAISLNLKRQNIDWIGVTKGQITCGLAQLTAGKERMTRATIDYTRSNRGTVITSHKLRRGRHPARTANIPTDPIPNLLQCNPKCHQEIRQRLQRIANIVDRLGRR
jgi:hypothetical protein